MEYPPELIEEWTEKLGKSISEEIDEEILGIIDEEKKKVRWEHFFRDINLAEIEQYLKWQIP